MRKSFLFLSMLLSAQTAFSAWTFSEKPYELDNSIDACVASTATDHNDFEISFPKDRKNYPIIKLTNKFDREYVGATYFLEGKKIPFFGKNDSGRTELYMVPQSARDLEVFLGIVSRDRRLIISKLYNQGGRLATGSGELPLSGSSAAMRSLESCLGGGLLSQEQVDFISEVAQYETVRDFDATGLDYDLNMELGQRIYENLKSWKGEEKAAKDLAAEADAMKYAQDYLQLKNQERQLRAEISAKASALSQIEDDESFFASADSLISSLESNIQNARAQKRVLDQSIAARNETLRGHDERLGTLNAELDREQQAFERATISLRNVERAISNSEALISSLRGELSSSYSREDDLVRNTVFLREARYEAENNYNNRSRLRRDIEERLYRQFGGSEERLERKVQESRGMVTRLRNEETAISNLVDELEETVDLTQKVSSFNEEIARIRSDLQCFRRSQGSDIKNCLTDSMNAINAQLNVLNERKREQEKEKCRRIFNIGEKKCKRKRDERIKKIQDQINEVQAEKNQLQERIRIINQTGNDPQKDQTIARLERRLNEKVSLQNRAIADAKRKIDSIRPGRNGNPGIQNLKSCDPKPRATCERIAQQAVNRTNQEVEKIQNDINQQERELQEAERNLTALRNALRREVDGLEQRLLNEFRQAERAYQDNLNAIANEDALQNSKERQISDEERNLSVARADLGPASRAQSEARSRRDSAQNAITNFKVRVGYDELLSARRDEVNERSSLVSRINAQASELSEKKQRKDRIASEIATYPEQKLNLSQEMSSLNGELASVLPQLRSKEENIEVAERRASDARYSFGNIKSLVRQGMQVIKNQF